jgi:hypothetical protein
MIARVFAMAALTLAALTAPAWAAPDLTVEMYGRSDRLGGQTYAIGQPVSISFAVQNNGDTIARGTNSAGTAGYMVDVIISTDATAPVRFATYSATFAEDALLLGGRMSRTDDIAPGASALFEGPTVMLGSPLAPYNYLNFTLPSRMRPGNYNICVQVDPGARITESNEINNTTCMALTLRARLPRPISRP